MKVLMLGNRGSVHAIRPLKQLLDQGCEVFYMDNINPYPKGKFGYIYINYPLVSRCISRKVGPLIGSLFTQITIIPYLKLINHKVKPDIVHVHWIDCHASYVHQAGLKPLVLSAWGSDINNCFSANVKPWYKKGIGESISAAETVIVDAPDIAVKCNILAGKPVQSEFIHLGVKTSKFSRDWQQESSLWRESLNIPQDATVFLSARALSPFYQHEQILEAFFETLQKVRKPIFLVFKSYNMNGNEYLKKIKNRVAELEIENKVRWLQDIPEEKVPEIYAMSDIIINNPKQDTFPVTFLEAAASGKQVISCMLPSYRGTFAENYFRFFAGSSPESLSKEMALAAEEQPMQKDGIKALQTHIEMEFDEKIYIHKLLQVYRRIIEKGTKGGHR